MREEFFQRVKQGAQRCWQWLLEPWLVRTLVGLLVMILLIQLLVRMTRLLVPEVFVSEGARSLPVKEVTPPASKEVAPGSPAESVPSAHPFSIPLEEKELSSMAPSPGQGTGSFPLGGVDSSLKELPLPPEGKAYYFDYPTADLLQAQQQVATILEEVSVLSGWTIREVQHPTQSRYYFVMLPEQISLLMTRIREKGGSPLTFRPFPSDFPFVEIVATGEECGVVLDILVQPHSTAHPPGPTRASESGGGP